MADGQRLAGTLSLRIRGHSVGVSGDGKGFWDPEPLQVLPSLAAAPWASHCITLAWSCGRAAFPSPAFQRGGELSAPSNWVIPGTHDLEANLCPLWRDRFSLGGHGGAELRQGWRRGLGCDIPAKTSWYHPIFQCKGLGNTGCPRGERRLYQGGGSFWWRQESASASDQTQVPQPGLRSAARAAGEGRLWNGHILQLELKPKLCLRPANLQSRQLGCGTPR